MNESYNSISVNNAGVGCRCRSVFWDLSHKSERTALVLTARLCVSRQLNATARARARRAAPRAATAPAAAAAWAVEEEEREEERAAPAAPAARAASTTRTTWKPPTWLPPPSSTCPRAAERCPRALPGKARSSWHRWGSTTFSCQFLSHAHPFVLLIYFSLSLSLGIS